MASFGRKAKEIVSAVAPTIGAMLGGPFGGLAGVILASVLGTKDPKQMEKMILSQDPNILLKLKEAEIAAQLKEQELNLNFEQLAVSDRTSARELAKTNMTPQIVLSCLYVVGYMCLIALIMLGEIRTPPEWKETTIALIGVLTAGVTQVTNFWLGSSSGSQRKTHLLSQAEPV